MTGFRGLKKKSQVQIMNGFHQLTKDCELLNKSPSSITNQNSSSFFFSSSFPTVIFISQILFGIFPICGLRHYNSTRLSFKFKSFAFVYTILVQCGIAFMFTISIYKQLNSHIEYTKVGERIVILISYDACRLQTHQLYIAHFLSVKFVFFFLNFLVYLNFTLIASRWPKFVSHWENSEQKFLELRLIKHQDGNLKRKLKKIFILIMFLAFSKFSYYFLFQLLF